MALYVLQAELKGYFPRICRIEWIGLRKTSSEVMFNIRSAGLVQILGLIGD